MSRQSWIHEETKRLTASWERHDRGMLRDYLVSDVEDPRLNVQSILTRHFLIRALYGERFEEVMFEELRFAVLTNWWLQLLKQPLAGGDFLALRHALALGADDAEGLEIPGWVTENCKAIPEEIGGVAMENYLLGLAESSVSCQPPGALEARILSTFERLWRQLLARRRPKPIRVLEPACGSANDYRFLHSYGLSRALRYTGFDLSPKNIANARQMFPPSLSQRMREAQGEGSCCFRKGNVLTLPATTLACDYCMVHDLFEHLSIEAMQLAVGRISRAARSGLCLGFFNMHEGEEHRVQRVEDYHWNCLSLPLVRAMLLKEGFEIQAIHIGTLLAHAFECPSFHNPNAYTLCGWKG